MGWAGLLPSASSASPESAAEVLCGGGLGLSEPQRARRQFRGGNLVGR